MWALSLLAAEDPLTRPEIIYGVAGLVGAMLVGAIAISLTDKWRKRATAPAHDATDMLTNYRDMYEHGEITEAEYTELRRKVADKVKNAPAPVAPRSPTRPGAPIPRNSRSPRRPIPGRKPSHPRRPRCRPNRPQHQEPPNWCSGQNPYH
ncbi:hypothetical protein VT84_29665 [Gemmata sp. SH-PL17]|uniref:SHOCT domain-containing protein n=1 Tax=Gemmata sp. SH-PL17 TaxID=1630693 RepID=UPI00078B27CD|nr:SHOCT domain-containing protein [Gemmata sp. SH-PL17]AMV28609.1 hypothetical protein VT84_29665 [Gemmata sp. SH-PL17]